MLYSERHCFRLEKYYRIEETIEERHIHSDLIERAMATLKVIFSYQQLKYWCVINTVPATNTKHSTYEGCYGEVNFIPARPNRPLQVEEQNLIIFGFLSFEAKVTLNFCKAKQKLLI